MQKLLIVLAATVAVPGALLAATAVEAGDGVVLVGCDLFGRNGPRVTFVHSHGVSKSSSNRRRFVSSSGSRLDDLEGKECAEVLSAAFDDGLDFEAMKVFGEESELALWFFRD
jgi:hypothetical protein